MPGKCPIAGYWLVSHTAACFLGLRGYWATSVWQTAGLRGYVDAYGGGDSQDSKLGCCVNVGGNSPPEGCRELPDIENWQILRTSELQNSINMLVNVTDRRSEELFGARKLMIEHCYICTVVFWCSTSSKYSSLPAIATVIVIVIVNESS